MISLLDILLERHTHKPSERIKSYSERIKSLKDKVAKKEGSKEQLDLWKGQIRAVTQTMTNYKQQLSIKKAAAAKKEAEKSKENA